MGKELEAWLDQIRRSPSDLTLRLVFADWLDEHPAPIECETPTENFFVDSHEFVASQIRYQIQEGGREHEVDTLSAPQITWGWGLDCLRDRSHVTTKWTWQNGLVERVTVSLHTFVQHHKEIFSVHPVCELELAYFTPSQNFAGQHWWAKSDGVATQEDRIWVELFDEMKRLERHVPDVGPYPNQVLRYATRGDAKKALREAAVNFGRRATHLSPLYQPYIIGPVS